jgi:hypothetical protein
LRDLACAYVLNSARRGAMEDKPVCALAGQVLTRGWRSLCCFL